MSHVMKVHEAPNPSHVCLFRPSTSMPHPQRLTNLCEELGCLFLGRSNGNPRWHGHGASFGVRDQPIVK
jgi:hypothetical protein